MAIELARIRRVLRDRKISDLQIPTAYLEETFADAMDELAIEMGAGDIVQTGFATVSAAGSTITVSSTYPAMRYLKELVRESDGRPLVKTTYELIMWNRAYGGSEFGQPCEYALVPGPDETVLLEVFPTPQTPEVLTAVWEPVLSEVTLVTGTIPFTPTGLRALRARVSARAINSIPEARQVEIGISPTLAEDLMRQSKDAAAEEWHRVHAGEMQDHIVRAR
jgi:hypothetical protein